MHECNISFFLINLDMLDNEEKLEVGLFDCNTCGAYSNLITPIVVIVV